MRHRHIVEYELGPRRAQRQIICLTHTVKALVAASSYPYHRFY